MTKTKPSSPLLPLATLLLLLTGLGVPSLAAVRINEFLASNDAGLQDEDGEASDWIELYNDGPAPVSLEGWSLSDDPEELDKWVFPAIEISADGYLVVFASDKNRKPTDGSPLHTNFKLSASGEYFALIDNASPAQAVSEFTPAFPEQSQDVSYGWVESASLYAFFDTPSPGSENTGSYIIGAAPDVIFGTERGFHPTPFLLNLTAPESGLEIRYTTDGSTPSATHGAVFSAPFSLANGQHVVRAIAYGPGYLPSLVGTHTYLVGLNAYFELLPAVSLVTDATNLTGPTGIVGMSDPTRIAEYINDSCPRWDPAAHGPDEYCNTIFHGREWERPVSMEYIDPSGSQIFQLDAGIRVHGSDYTRPRLCRNSKFSYRIYFRGDYGEPQLLESIFPRSMMPEWDKLVARGGLDDRINPFMRDELLRRCWVDMGHVGIQGTFVHLFVNGEYVGYYNVTERPDQQFLQTWYNDTSTEWDVIKRRGDITDGDSVAWDALLAQAPAGPQPMEDRYDELEPLMDIENFADYILLNAYTATWDWPENNWVAYRPRVPGGKFKFLCWDAEGAFGYDGQGVNYHLFLRDLYRVASSDNEIPRIFRALIGSATFKEILEYRASLHFFGDGALTDENLMARYDEIADVLSPVIPNFDNLPNNDYPDLDDDYSIGSYWIPNRRPFFLAQLDEFGLEPMALPTATVTHTPEPTSTPTATLTETPAPTSTLTQTPVPEPTDTPDADLNGDEAINAEDLLLLLEAMKESP